MYIKKCIRSIQHQTYKTLEIILIDDGSTDKSARICDVLAKSDKRIIVKHEKNEGVSVSRNKGISLATGKYICFVDSDDWLPKNSIELLVLQSEKYNADLCIGGVLQVNVLNAKKLCKTENNCISRKDSDAVVGYFRHITEVYGPWGKLYKTDIIKKNQLEFKKEMRYAEDTHFLWRYIQFSNLLAEVEEIVYNYNLMVLESASKKNYDQQGEWLYSLITETKKCFKTSDYNNQNVINYISDYTFKMYRIACEKYINSNLKYNVNNFVRNTGNIFKDDLIKYQNTEEKKQFVTWIEKDDVGAIIQELSHNQEITRSIALKKQIAKIIGALRKLFIFKIMR